jgi:hypothetical protein
MPDYSNGKIYTIRFHNSNEIYIGSTTQSLAVRFGEHKRDISVVYRLINDKYKGNWSVCYYELYENYSCNNVEELRRKEGEVIRKFKDDENFDCINCLIAGRTAKEYRKDNACIIKEKKQQYYQENIKIVKEKHKQYYENNAEKIKEKIKQYQKDSTDKIKEHKKQYYQENMNTIKEHKKQYREDNADKIYEKINCDCGSCISKSNLSTHFKSKKHQDYLASLHQPQ